MLDSLTRLITRLSGRAFAGGDPVARVALNTRPVDGPWGGGNQWANQLIRALRATGYEVRFDLTNPVDCIVIAHTGDAGTATFGLAEIEPFLAKHPRAVCVHRVNENDERKNTTGVDARLRDVNALADHTVFVSTWLRDYHAARWFDTRRPHTVILNGADPRWFHPVGGAVWAPGTPLRLVTHHWSRNPRKGFAVYRQLDDLIADGKLADTELRVIGRWPDDIGWRAAKTSGPLTRGKLGDALRQCHVYVTASLSDPGPMHCAEGLQCGLPAVYHRAGGGIVEAAAPSGVGFVEDVAAAILEMRERYRELRAVALDRPPSGDLMCAAYRHVIQQTIVCGSRR